MVVLEEMKRLAFIRELHRQAGRFAEAGGPMAATAILLMHDGVELFLLLLAEKLNVAVKTDTQFMQYWERIPSLTHKKSMDRLNTARNALKHKGLLPSIETIRELHPVVHSFLLDNTQALLGLDFDGVSMVDVVADAEIRELLKQASEKLEAKDAEGAIAEAAKAEHIIAASLGRQFLQHPSSFGPPGDEWARKAILGLVDMIILLALDVQPQSYARFRRMAPSLARSGSGQWQVRWRGQDVTEEDARFAIDFVTDIALAAERVLGE